MPTCEAKAVLLVTDVVEGTSTTVARHRIELRCDRDSGHEGLHQNAEHAAQWEEAPGRVHTILRQGEP